MLYLKKSLFTFFHILCILPKLKPFYIFPHFMYFTEIKHFFIMFANSRIMLAIYFTHSHTYFSFSRIRPLKKGQPGTTTNGGASIKLYVIRQCVVPKAC